MPLLPRSLSQRLCLYFPHTHHWSGRLDQASFHQNSLRFQGHDLFSFFHLDYLFCLQPPIQLRFYLSFKIQLECYLSCEISHPPSISLLLYNALLAPFSAIYLCTCQLYHQIINCFKAWTISCFLHMPGSY